MYPADLASGRGSTGGTLASSEVRPDAPSPILRRGSRRPGPGGLWERYGNHRCRKGRPGEVPRQLRGGRGGQPGLDEAAIEVDVFLTNDRVPVLVDGPRLDGDTCRTVDGDPLGDDVWLIKNDLVDLDDTFRCGVEPAPEWPDARVGAAPVTLDTLMEQIQADPPGTVLLDLRWTPNVSHDPDVFAAEVLERWWREAPPTRCA